MQSKAEILFEKLATKLGFMRKGFFSHTTSRSALSNILSSGKIKTGRSLGKAGQGFRNMDDMVPDSFNEYVSTGKNTIYTSGKRFRAILMKSPKNEVSNLGKESLLKGDVALSLKNTRVAVPANRLSGYQKKYPKYKFIASEDIKTKRITKYQPNKEVQEGINWGELNQAFGNY